jgi:hypothetical protein
MTDLGDGLTLEIHAGEGYRMVMRGNINVCIDNSVETAFNVKCREQAGDVKGKAVAWIGGGMCIGPRLFDGAVQTVYEILPALKTFCPEGVQFVPGDWRNTLTGKFDVIVYDIGGEVPREELAKFLAAGGLILPLEAP